MTAVAAIALERVTLTAVPGSVPCALRQHATEPRPVVDMAIDAFADVLRTFQPAGQPGVTAVACAIPRMSRSCRRAVAGMVTLIVVPAPVCVASVPAMRSTG